MGDVSSRSASPARGPLRSWAEGLPAVLGRAPVPASPFYTRRRRPIHPCCVRGTGGRISLGPRIHGSARHRHRHTRVRGVVSDAHAPDRGRVPRLPRRSGPVAGGRARHDDHLFDALPQHRPRGLAARDGEAGHARRHRRRHHLCRRGHGRRVAGVCADRDDFGRLRPAWDGRDVRLQGPRPHDPGDLSPPGAACGRRPRMARSRTGHGRDHERSRLPRQARRPVGPRHPEAGRDERSAHGPYPKYRREDLDARRFRTTGEPRADGRRPRAQRAGSRVAVAGPRGHPDRAECGSRRRCHVHVPGSRSLHAGHVCLAPAARRRRPDLARGRGDREPRHGARPRWRADRGTRRGLQERPANGLRIRRVGPAIRRHARYIGEHHGDRRDRFGRHRKHRC